MTISPTHLRTLLATVCVLILTGPSFSQEAIVTIPVDAVTQEGDVTGTAPGGPGRGQWLFFASDFDNLPLSFGEIAGIALRPDETSGPTTSTSSRFTLKLSTTSITSLNPVFNANFGDSVDVVYDGPLTWSSNETVGVPAKAFEYRVDFESPFIYRPEMGNLVVDWTTSGFAPLLLADSQTYPNANVNVSAFASGTSPNVATLIEPISSVVQFRFVPEPSSMILWITGFLGLLSFHTRYMRRT